MNWNALYPQVAKTKDPMDAYAEMIANQKAQGSANTKNTLDAMQMQINILKHQLDQQKFTHDQLKEFDDNNKPINIIQEVNEDGELEHYIVHFDAQGNFDPLKKELVSEEQLIGYKKYNADIQKKRDLIGGGYATANNVNNPDIYSSASTKAKQDEINNQPPPSGIEKQKGKGWLGSIGSMLVNTYQQMSKSIQEKKEQRDLRKKADADWQKELELREQDKFNASVNRALGTYELPVREEVDNTKRSITKVKNEGNVPTYSTEDMEGMLQKKLDTDKAYRESVKKKLKRQGATISKDTTIKVAPKKVEVSPNIMKQEEKPLPGFSEYKIMGVAQEEDKGSNVLDFTKDTYRKKTFIDKLID